MKSRRDIKVAIVGEGFFFFEGTNRVNKVFCEMFPDADIYGMFGDRKLMEKEFKGHKYRFSFLQRYPLLKKYYKYTYFLWPLAVESFDLHRYDLVISSSYSCALGCVVPYPIKHISYIHTPMRYAWDLKDMYFNKRNFSLWKRQVIPLFLNYLRSWDVCASQRPDILVSNSEFVGRRMYKYWKRKADFIVYPPVDLYKGKIQGKRNKYFVAGISMEPNKNGKLLFEYAKKLNIPLYVIGRCPWKVKMRYRKCNNIKFLGYVTDKEKYRILSKAAGYITLGIEDFGIFPVEAMSCGTPVLYYKYGGVRESVVDGKTGISIEKLDIENFKKSLELFKNTKWNYKGIAKYSKKFSKERFKREIRKIVNKLG